MLNFTTLLTDSIYISADYAIIMMDIKSTVSPDDGIICRNIY
jgi:hypothetical protein